MDDRSIDASPY